MSQILVVGHTLSGYENVEKALIDSGMCPGRPALREEIYPAELDAILCKACGVAPEGFSSSSIIDPVEQLKVDPVWNDLILDLIRGNLEQKLWGWSDPLAVCLLEFWKSTLPDLLFVLVYNHPRTALSDVWQIAQTKSQIGDLAKNSLDSWYNYNDALYDFFNRNSERCLLIHEEQIQCEGNGILDDIMDRMRLLRARSDMFVGNNITGFPSPMLGDTKDLIYKGNWAGSQGNSVTEQTPLFLSDALSNDFNCSIPTDLTEKMSLESYVADSVVLENQSREIQLYENLQSVATTPHWKHQVKPQTPEVSALDAWYELKTIVGECRRLYGETSQLKSELEALESEHREAKISQCKMVDENNFLVSQLFSVQEELVEKLVEQKNDQQRITDLEQRLVAAEQREVTLQQRLEKK